MDYQNNCVTNLSMMSNASKNFSNILATSLSILTFNLQKIITFNVQRTLLGILIVHK